MPINTLQPLIDYAKTEHLRLLIEVFKDGYTVLYCDKTRKREFLKQIRLNNIKTRIKFVTYDYKIRFLETPQLVELNYIRSRIIKTFLKERTIRKYNKWTPQYLYNIVTVDFPEVDNHDFVSLVKGCFFTELSELKIFLKDINISATINRDKDTFIVYYRDDG